MMTRQNLPCSYTREDGGRYALDTYTGRDALERHLRSRLEDLTADANDAERAELRKAGLDAALWPEVVDGELYDPDSEEIENLLVSKTDMPAARQLYASVRDQVFRRLDDEHLSHRA